MAKASLFLLVFTLVALPAAAQTAPPPQAPAAAVAEPDYPVIKIGVLSYLQYDAELQNRSGFNVFDVTRAYLNVNGQLARNIRFRFTPDIKRSTDGNLSGTLVLRVKYAFAQFDNLVNERSWIRLGAHQTPWLDFEESIDRYRVQGTMFSERENLIPGSSDFGASYFTPLPKGFGEVHVGVFNGEGYTQTDTNKYKSLQARLTVRPFPNRGAANGLRVSGFFNAGAYTQDHPRHLGILMGSFEQKNLVVTLQGLSATENPVATSTRNIKRNGWSVFCEPRQGPAGWAGILRLDSFDPDRTLLDNSQQRVIAGGAYWFVRPRSRVGVVATNEQIHYDSPTRPTENRLLVQTHIEF